MENAIIDQTPVPAPTPRTRQIRMSPKLRALQPGQSFLTDYATARCFTAFCRKRGYKAVQKRISGDQVRVWRVS